MFELAYNPNLFLVFFVGMTSFFSPCIFPLLPVYISYLAGTQISEQFTSKERIRLMVNTVAFVLGISFVFITIGLGATKIGDILHKYEDALRVIGGIFVIMMGLFYSGILKINILNSEKRFNLKNYRANVLQSFLLGLTFSFGWTPCIGASFTPVLVMSSVQGFFLIVVYTIGFCVPFLIMSLVASFSLSFVRGINKHIDKIKLISGFILIFMGILLLIDKFSIVKL